MGGRFSEFFEPDLYIEYHIVILDARGASQIFGKGHTTCVRLNAVAEAAGKNKVNIYYESDAVGCPAPFVQIFSKGDLLLSIERASRGYLLRWKALAPTPTPQPLIYREDQGITKDGRKSEGPFWGKGFSIMCRRAEPVATTFNMWSSITSTPRLLRESTAP